MEKNVGVNRISQSLRYIIVVFTLVSLSGGGGPSVMPVDSVILA